jgi:hypothetical protein
MECVKIAVAACDGIAAPLLEWLREQLAEKLTGYLDNGDGSGAAGGTVIGSVQDECLVSVTWLVPYAVDDLVNEVLRDLPWAVKDCHDGLEDDPAGELVLVQGVVTA